MSHNRLKRINDALKSSFEAISIKSVFNLIYSLLEHFGQSLIKSLIAFFDTVNAIGVALPWEETL